MGIHGIDEVILDSSEFFGAEVTFEQVDLSRGDRRRLFSSQNRDALGCRVCTLVELARKKFNGESVSGGREVLCGRLGKGLGKDEIGGLLELLLIELIDEVALEEA